MKNFSFLKPVFTVGMIVILSFLLIANLLIFKYLVGAGIGLVWFIVVEELAVVIGYWVARGFTNADYVPWGFARRWWSEVTPKS